MENPNLADGNGRAPGESIPKSKNTDTFSAQAAQPLSTPQLAGAVYTDQIALPLSAAAAAPPQPAAPFVCTQKDSVFALLFFALGYLFIHWFVGLVLAIDPYNALYTVFYAALVLGYLYGHGKRPTRESWFWLGVMLCLGGPIYLFSDFYGGGLLDSSWQFLLLIFVSAYWTLCASGALYEGKTSNWIALDVANALFFVPFCNFDSQPRVLTRGIHNTNAGRKTLSVALGLLLALPLLGFVLPSLLAADSRFESWFSSLFQNLSLPEFLFEFLLSLPVSLFLFGLCFGVLHGRHTEVLKRDDMRKLGRALRLAPDLAVTTALCAVCAVYLLFILFQGGYLFSAFSGRLPEDFTFAEYARSGFFELCRVCGINVAVLLGANLFSKTLRIDNRALRVMNLVVCALTLLLIATAGSKMGLYIAAYGLTPLRVLSSVFLLWLAIVFVLVIVWQVRPIAPVRLAVLAGAALVALMCALPVLPGIEAYNHAHFGDTVRMDTYEWYA